jgi:hypothetical protein
MNRFILTALMLSLSFSSFAQDGEGDIRIQKNFGGTRFFQDDRLLKPKDVLNAMAPNDEAFNLFKKAKSNYDAAQVFGFIGGFMIGWPLGTAIAGGDPQWGIAAGGAGALLLSIPFSSAFNKHARNAVEIYNREPLYGRGNRVSVSLVPYGAGGKAIIRF